MASGERPRDAHGCEVAGHRPHQQQAVHAAADGQRCSLFRLAASQHAGLHDAIHCHARKVSTRRGLGAQAITFTSRSCVLLGYKWTVANASCWGTNRCCL
eukprot:scaffold223758_cov22-Tisochrysis_lutea.AAC.1